MRRRTTTTMYPNGNNNANSDRDDNDDVGLANHSTSTSHSMQDHPAEEVCYFTLSIPVQGMEQLVLDVGSCSGHFGSKFPLDYTTAVTSTTSNAAATHSPTQHHYHHDDKNNVTLHVDQSGTQQTSRTAVGVVDPDAAASARVMMALAENPERGGQAKESRKLSAQQQRHHRHHYRFPQGIPGLEVVWLPIPNPSQLPLVIAKTFHLTRNLPTKEGEGEEDHGSHPCRNPYPPSPRHSWFGGIEGCVAHLYCRIVHILPHPNIITTASMATTATQRSSKRRRRRRRSIRQDDRSNEPSNNDELEKEKEDDTNTYPQQEQEHSLIMAQVEVAYVLSEYWDEKKKLFRPNPDLTSNKHVPPYLTFLGSQTFGYVHMGVPLRQESLLPNSTQPS